mmetsp:Transcript_28533/g.45819  ORF Transcript_28533/g.45819 Transcript_28533/m.45819 type:complete len:344 (+) Transcript_28533:210-1241(+)
MRNHPHMNRSCLSTGHYILSKKKPSWMAGETEPVPGAVYPKKIFKALTHGRTERITLALYIRGDNGLIVDYENRACLTWRRHFVLIFCHLLANPIVLAEMKPCLDTALLSASVSLYHRCVCEHNVGSHLLSLHYNPLSAGSKRQLPFGRCLAQLPPFFGRCSGVRRRCFVCDMPVRGFRKALVWIEWIEPSPSIGLKAFHKRHKVDAALLSDVTIREYQFHAIIIQNHAQLHQILPQIFLADDTVTVSVEAQKCFTGAAAGVETSPQCQEGAQVILDHVRFHAFQDAEVVSLAWPFDKTRCTCHTRCRLAGHESVLHCLVQVCGWLLKGVHKVLVVDDVLRVH